MPSVKSFPVCAQCGKLTCQDCGAGFATPSEYLRHRMEPHKVERTAHRH